MIENPENEALGNIPQPQETFLWQLIRGYPVSDLAVEDPNKQYVTINGQKYVQEGLIIQLSLQKVEALMALLTNVEMMSENMAKQISESSNPIIYDI